MTFHELDALYADKLEVLGAIEQTVGPLSSAQLSYRPDPESWSVAGILEHLAVVEPGMLRVVSSLCGKAASLPGAGPFQVALDDGIRTGATGKIKTRPEAVPTGKIPAADSLHVLRGIQADLLALRPRIAALDVASAKFPHRVLGDMTLGQWCAFIGAHEARHLGQMRSVISSAGFPR